MARPIRYCKVSYCGRRCKGLGYCNKHYRQFKEHGKIIELTTNEANVMKQKQSGEYTSEYKGVSWHKSKQKWRARIGIDSRMVWLGYYPDEVSAAIAYNKAAVLHYGDLATLNEV